MRTLPLVVMVVILGTLASPAFGQEPAGVAFDGDGGTRAAPSKAPAQAEGGAPPEAGSKSGFGQVMALLTGLLQDAAQREASGGKEGFALDNPAVVVSVTPVEGADSFVRRDAATVRDDDRPDDGRRDDRRRDAPRNAANARLAAQPNHSPDATPR